MLSRREFVSTLAGASAVLAAPAPVYEPKLAVQCYVFNFVYGLHKQRMEDNISEVFSTMNSAGFHNAELMPSFFTPDNSTNTSQSLMLARLQAPVVYMNGILHTADGAKQTTDAALALAKRAKAVHPVAAINLSADAKPNDEAKSEAELTVQSDAVNRLARDFKKLNVRLMLHHHAAEMAQEAREYRHMLKTADPKLVDFCLDIDWVRKGGQDPLALMKDCGSRLGALHVRNSVKGVWSEDFGDGDIDYAPIAAALKQAAFRGYIVVELAYDKATDMTRTLEENLKRSREYAEKVFSVKA